MLCALFVSAIAAQGASAAIVGTTAFTCKKPVAGDTAVGEKFSKAHCKTEASDNDTSPTGEYRHVQFNQDTTTELEGNNNDTEGKPIIANLVSTQAGVEEELQAEIVEKKPGTEASMENKKEGTEHYITGKGTLTYTKVKVTKPAGKGCAVTGEGGAETVSTKELKATTLGVAGGMGLKFEPATGTVFSEFEITGCSVAALNGTYKAEGSLIASLNGATINTTAAGVKAQGTLKLRGQAAGLGGTLTLSGRDKTLKEVTYTPLSATTIEE
jgi:hypothetical protein